MKDTKALQKGIRYWRRQVLIARSVLVFFILAGAQELFIYWRTRNDSLAAVGFLLLAAGVVFWRILSKPCARMIRLYRFQLSKLQCE
jgi:hypothetical protein